MKSFKLGLKSIGGVRSNLASCFSKSKLLLWFLLSLAISLIFLQEFWANLVSMLSPDWIFGQNHAAPWGILGLCGIWLWLKRKNISRDMELRQNPFFIPMGLALVAGAVLIPPYPDFLVFQVLLASLGVFIIFFGRGARIPSILLAIYGFAISFPLMIARFAEAAYSQTAITPLLGIMTTLGYQIENQGQWIYFTSSSGEPISAVITAACAGPATMGVFIALFALMMLDMPLPPRKAVRLFLFGIVGTWFQSLVRLIILILMGYYLGEDALWAAHSWSIYILFPLWYLFFAYIYFRQARGNNKKLQPA